MAKKMVNQMSNNRPPWDGYKATRSEGKIHKITWTIGQNRGSTPNSYIKPGSTTLTTEVVQQMIYSTLSTLSILGKYAS